jgi:hypothetical protein
MSCLNLRAGPGAVKSVVPFAAQSDPDRVGTLPDDQLAPAANGPARKPWVVRVPVDALDHRKNGGLGHRFGWMLLVLEAYCRDRCFCWAGNAELAAAYGVSPNVLQAILKDMEDAGILRRVPTSCGRPGRLGIVLFRRANPDLPVAAPEGLADVVARMNGGPARSPRSGRLSPLKTGCIERPENRAPSALKTGPLRMTNLKEDEPTLTFARAGGGDPDPEAAPAPIEPAPAEAPDRPQEPAAPPEAMILNPDPAGPAPGPSGDPAPRSEAEADPALTPEQVEAAIAELEARIARQAPRPPGAMDRIRLANLKALRDGTWKAAPLAAETPRLPAWPTGIGPAATASGPVETVDLIRRIAAPGSGPEAVEEAAVRVAARLRDDHSLNFYRGVFRRVQAGEVPVARVMGAWKSASGGTARSPGSVFNAFLKGGVR